MINPEGIPHFTGDLGLLDHHVTGLQNNADGIRRAGDAAHTRFQALSGFYQAPEATDLFASTAPVRDGADAFADKVETVAAALAEYGQTVKPIIDRLAHLKVKAAAFVASVDKDTYRGSGEWTHGPVDNDWTKNQDKVDEHTALMNGVAEAKAAFEAAEIAAHNKITALVGGTQYMQQSNHMLVPFGVKFYGATAETYEHAQKLPWGSPQGLTHSGWDIGYQIKEHVWDGFVVDGVVGTLDGVFTMAGGHGTDQAKLAWEGLTRAIVGGETYLQESSGQKATGFWASDFAQGSKPYAKETGKAFLKWDMWKTNPARASGSVVTFNLLPFAGAATAARVSAAGKAGAGAKAVLTAARIADAVDPVSTAVRATRYALPKISEVTANVRNGLGEFRAAKGPESVLELSDGSTLHVGNGEFTAGKNGIPHPGAIPHELPAAERAASATVRPQEPALVGAGARAAEGRMHASENLPARASHEPRQKSGPTPSSGRAGHGSGDTSAGSHNRSGSEASTARENSNGSGPVSQESGSAKARATGHGGHGSEGSRGSEGSEAGTPHEPVHDHDPEHADNQEPHEGHGEEGTADTSTPHDTGRHGGGDGEPDFTRPTLPPGDGSLSLRELRAVRGFRRRFEAAEEFGRETWGGDPERHFPVPMHDHPYYPVSTPMGRKVDVPVDLPDGRVLAVEIKHYLEFRTVKLEDGTNKVVQGEVPLNKGIMEQINKDLTLRRLDPSYDPRWVFTGAHPSPALQGYLKQARIIFVTYGPAPR
ncbi:hypothetical protein BKI49_10200 [Streptomyces sp. Tue6028]|uniref:hypothetical protein n=1 Tax=Streptomyces sp. Tue6028 TaxID=2036037 RepID=UPI000BB3B659|nr:hypothetical protein [Streptomyces sp. Tue6028]PBC64064.1 hypothetical protein BKI49_10200 [Streptomyces sp. Tue6028]